MFNNAINEIKNQIKKDVIKNNNEDEKEQTINKEKCIPYESLAMAYVPFQKWIETYDPETALVRGTLFPDLDKPFLGEEAVPSERKR